MKVGGAVVYGGGPRGNVVPLLLSGGRASLRFPSSSYSSSSSTPRAAIANANLIQDHVSFVKDVAATQPPQHLSNLLTILKTRGTPLPKLSFFSINHNTLSCLL